MAAGARPSAGCREGRSGQPPATAGTIESVCPSLTGAAGSAPTATIAPTLAAFDAAIDFDPDAEEPTR